MNANKLTQRSLEAIQGAQSIAVEHDNQQVDQEHLLYALLTQEDSLAASLLGRMGVDAEAFARAVEDALGKIPRVTGSGREADKIYVTPQLDRALNEAEKQAARMKDEYTSVEHLFLGLIEAPNDALKKLFRDYKIERNAYLAALGEVRGGARVTSDSPEGTYDALGKYAQIGRASCRERVYDDV